MIDVDVEVEMDGMLVAKISSEQWELNVRASAADFLTLNRIDEADWDERGSLRVGLSAGVPVFWSSRQGTVTALVGHDDETWDIAITMPTAAVQEVVAAVTRLS